MERSGDAAVGKNLVNNLKTENASDEVIYKELTALVPDVGCPLARYKAVDSGYMAARRSEQAVRREANEVASRASTEFANKRQCIEAERKARREQTLATNLMTPPSTNNMVNEDRSVIKPGHYVFVAQDLSPGKFSHGGEAWVKAVHGTGGSIVCNVEYIKSTGGNITQEEKAVPLSRLTVKINAWHEAQLLRDGDKRRGSKRQRQQTTKPKEKQKSKEPKPLKNILSLVCQSGKSKGWRAREVGFGTSTSKKNAHFRDCFRRDLAELKSFLSAVPDAQRHSDRGRDGTWKARGKQHSPFTIKVLTICLGCWCALCGQPCVVGA
jgi:hypothetical protein